MTMHPRLHGVVIDVPRAEHARAVAFWSAAFGREPAVSAQYPDYAQFEDVTPGCYVLVQATGDDSSRVHLDFATDDRDTDLERLAGLGAQEVTREHKWAVMRDPSGQPFCLCPASSCAQGSGCIE
ncbi:MAG TPA: VOC family protein [Mycobacteriales bacterium]|nr:VOC family protein [Mycobacteriales bacterium]